MKIHKMHNKIMARQFSIFRYDNAELIRMSNTFYFHIFIAKISRSRVPAT